MNESIDAGSATSAHVSSSVAIDAGDALVEVTSNIDGGNAHG